jgi:hypothetical protein
MAETKKTVLNEKDLAERCRIALEKSYGMPVPLPKYFGKKNQNFRF